MVNCEKSTVPGYKLQVTGSSLKLATWNLEPAPGNRQQFLETDYLYFISK